MENRIWTLLARQLAGEATPEELEELEQLQNQDPAMKETVRNMRAGWEQEHNNMRNGLAAFARLDEKIQSQQHSSPAPVHSLRRRYLRLATVAAAACIVVISGAWLFHHFHNNENTVAKKEIKAPAKNIKEALLADGSTVLLNEGSEIVYNEDFNKRTREVWLSGEAFFEVAKNTEKPFIIHTGKVNIRVTGTAFNVRSYAADQKVETSLIRGSVEVTVQGEEDKKYVLKPNQKLVVSAPVQGKESEAATGTQEDVRFFAINKVPDSNGQEVIPEISWMDRKLAFYEEPFKELAEQMSSRYNVSFVFQDKQAEALVFTGVFNKQKLPQALHALSLSAPFHYQINNNIVYITK